MTAPVVFLIFNRPDLTQRVFEQIRAARPPKLLIVADGPRAHVPSDEERCRQTREVVSRVDWDCEVLKNFSSENLGCKRRVASGITWAFENVEEAIILEDDTVPHPDFFGFATELLEKYRDRPEIMLVGGTGRIPLGQGYPHSYFFSRIAYIWGWATWRRAWASYDVGMKDWPAYRDQGKLKELRFPSYVNRYFTQHFSRTYAGEVDTWDYQWYYAILKNNGICVHPQVNMISNIGFGPEATHTKFVNRYANQQRSGLGFPLSHPSEINVNPHHDRKLFREQMAVVPRLLNKVKSLLHMN